MAERVAGVPFEYRGRRVVCVPAEDVRVGDRLCCWLADASAYPRVTGWRDREYDLTVHGLGVAVQREYETVGGPWWVDVRMTTAGIDRLVYVLADRPITDSDETGAER
jgi:hypothetical protein